MFHRLMFLVEIEHTMNVPHLVLLVSMEKLEWMQSAWFMKEQDR